MLELAIGSLFDADYEAMRGWAAQALDGARPLADRPLAATAAGLTALAEASSGWVAQAEAHRAEALELVNAMPDAELATRLAAAGYLANAELYLDRFPDATAHARRGLDIARATGQMSPTLVPTLVTSLFMCGRIAEAMPLLEGAVESAHMSGIPQALAWTLVNRSQAAIVAGDIETGLACAEESFELTQRIDERFASAWSGLMLATALLASGDDAARAADVLLEAAGGEELGALPANWRVFGLRGAHSLPASRSASTTTRAGRSRAPRRRPPRWDCRWRPPRLIVPRRTSRSPPAKPPRPRSGRSHRRPPRSRRAP